MIPSARRQLLTAMVYRLALAVGIRTLPQDIRERLRRPPRPSYVARKAEEGSLMLGWTILTVLAAVLLVPIAAITSTYVRSNTQYQAIGDIVTGLLVFTASGLGLHLLRTYALMLRYRGSERHESYQEPGGTGRWILTSGDADLVVQALVTIAFVAIRLLVNPLSTLITPWSSTPRSAIMGR